MQVFIVMNSNDSKLREAVSRRYHLFDRGGRLRLFTSGSNCFIACCHAQWFHSLFALRTTSELSIFIESYLFIMRRLVWRRVMTLLVNSSSIIITGAESDWWMYNWMWRWKCKVSKLKRKSRSWLSNSLSNFKWVALGVIVNDYSQTMQMQANESRRAKKMNEDLTIVTCL